MLEHIILPSEDIITVVSITSPVQEVLNNMKIK